jgi:predicted ATPase
MTDHPRISASNSTPRFHSWASHGSGSRTNLPFPLTSFIGRTSQVAEITRLASTTRLLTLTGPGGVGKTRLAQEVAGQLRFADGVWMVDLAPLSQAGDVPQAVALALGVRQEAKRPALSTLVDALRERELLLLLDNCEHLIPACLEVIAALLGACLALSILATSREALGVGGELLWRVPSLSVPPSSFDQPAQGGAEAITEQVRSSEAVQLFLTRAQAVRPDFHLTPLNAAAIARICQRLDGIPLAIELAAARVQVLSSEQIAARLADRFGLLTRGHRLALPRQQTLRASLDWSYGLLEDGEQRLLRRLAVFAGAFSLEAAEAVCSSGEDGGPLEMLDGVSQLVNKSLVVMEEQEAQAHYRLLETVRQYALEKLEGSGEGERLRDQHLAYALALVRAAEPGLHGPEQVRWKRRVEQAYVNLRAACDWALDRKQWELALQLAAGLWPFWELSGRTAEGCAELEVMLQRTEQAGPTAACGQALLACGSLASQLGVFPLARTCLEEGLTIFRTQGNPQTLALAPS